MVPVSLLTSLLKLECWRFCGTQTSGDSSQGEQGYTLAPAYTHKGLAIIRRLATTVQELHLIKMSFSTPGECTKLVSSIPALRELHCVDVHFKMPQADEVLDTCINRLAPRLHVESLSLINVQTQGADLLLRMLQSTIETLTVDVRMAVNDPTLILISRLEKLRSLKLFVHIESEHTFAAEIKLATDVLDSLVRLHTLTIEIEYQSYAMLGFLSDSSAETAEVYQRFEESSIRLNTSRVLFVVRSDRRERTVYWTQTLQHIFPTLYNRCQFRVQCQRVLQDKPLYGHDGILVDLVASPDGRWIASVSDDPTLIIWRLDRGDGGTAHLQVALDWTPDMYTSQLQFSPDSRYLASLSQQLAMTSIWDVITGTTARNPGRSTPQWFSNMGHKHRVVAGWNSHCI
ncbi:hypothetical protein C8Q74DRAFT_1299561 [Fomes fomentarius]|nr:hypothetical protein C8Q74DRAFT_1299561 [Fomes fomentarius]